MSWSGCSKDQPDADVVVPLALAAGDVLVEVAPVDAVLVDAVPVGAAAALALVT